MKWEETNAIPEDYDPDTYAKVMKFWRPEGQEYPIVLLAIYEDDSSILGGGIILSVNRKNAKECWWGRCGVPPELLGEVIDLLRMYHEARK